MEIKVICNSKERRGFILAVATLYAQLLNIRGSRYQIHIYTIPNLSKEQGSAGTVGKMNGTKIPRILVMLDSRLSARKLIRILAHEFIHVKQHVRGQLKGYIRKDGKYGWRWMGKIVRAEYDDQPWEIEARKREVILGNALIDLLNVA